MRYVKKISSPVFFEVCKTNLPENAEWYEFSENQELSECKKALHQHLIAEQAELCIYCERKISKDISHVEHIHPKDVSGKFAHLTFAYTNLVASCNGDLCDTDNKKVYKPEDVHSCGHKKANDFNEKQFINPVQDENIGEFFKYNKDTGVMSAANENARAEYTINLLNLNCIRLQNDRVNAVQAVFDVILKTNNLMFRQLSKQEMVRILLKRNPPFPFISFLHFYFAASQASIP